MSNGRYERVESNTELPTLSNPGPSHLAPEDSAYHPHSGRSHATSKSRDSSQAAHHPMKTDHQLFTAYSGGHATFRRTLFPWIWTIVLTITLVIVVKVYVGKGVMTSHEKDSFNGLSTALILLLGLSFFEAFKQLANNLKGRLQKWFQPPPAADRLIDGFDNLLQCARLAITKTEGVSFGLRAFCALWLALCIVALGASALISLTYTIEDGNDYNTVYNRKNTTEASDLTCFGGVKGDGKCPDPIVAQTLAHTYGQTSLALLTGGYDQLSETKNPDQDYTYYNRVTQNGNEYNQEFAYRFREYNPNDRAKAYPHFTNRIIRTFSGPCDEYTEQVERRKTATIGNIAARTSFFQGIQPVNITIPWSNLGNFGTTYIFNGIHEPEHAGLQFCGHRCLYMWAYRNDKDPSLFRCPITVSEVSNADQKQHRISEDTARIAASSIAIQGQFRVNNIRDSGDDDYHSFQFFAAGHPWEVHGLNASKVGANMAQSAIGAIATMVTRNPKIKIAGTVPHLGSKLSVRWVYFETLLVLIVAAHTLLLILNYLTSKPSKK